MQELDAILKAAGEDFGLELSLDESGACAFELDDGRTLMLQERAGVGELDFVASLGPVPAEARADVFERLLEANFYWRETFGAPIPEPGAPLDEDQKKLFRSIALQGGNFEIQKMNTGLAGFRSGKVASIAERLGSKEYSDFHRGGSSLV